MLDPKEAMEAAAALDKSQKSLDPTEAVRRFPNVLLGSKGIEGAQHTVTEIIGNVKDEHSAGFGDRYDLTLHEDGSISVRDYARGVPLGWDEREQVWNWERIFTKDWGGGKYEGSQKLLGIADWENFDIHEHMDIFSVGQHGLGASASQRTAEFFTVTSYRQNVASRMHFENGYPVGELEVFETDQPDGTLIHWKPDSKVFTDVNISDDWLASVAETDSFVSGISVRFNNRGEILDYPASNIQNLLQYHIHDNEDMGTYEHFEHETDNEGDKVVFYGDLAISKGRYVKTFHNQVSVQGGSHEEAINYAIRAFFSQRAAELDVKFKPIDYVNLISMVLATKSNKTSYHGQTKDFVTDHFIYQEVYNLVYGALQMEWSKKSDWITEVVKTARKNVENREQVENLQVQVKEINKALKKKTVTPKFASCESYDKNNSEDVELWICEGDSASGSLRGGRDGKFQAILPIRGKGLNVYKAPLPKILQNKEIQELISILGCGVDLGTDEVESFNINNLKVGKIIFASDADKDGYHIRMLLFTLFWKLFPQLLEEGRVFIAETPLYHMKTSTGEELFTLTEEESRAIKKKYNVVSTSRFKGLGEVDEDILWETTMNPATRKLVPLNCDPQEDELILTMEALFGVSTDVRKRKILSSLMGMDVDDLLVGLDETLSEISNSAMDTGLETIEVELD